MYETVTRQPANVVSSSYADPEPYLEKTKQDKRGGWFRLIRNPWM